MNDERMAEFEIAVEDVDAPGVHAILEAHLAFANEVTPVGAVHALDLDALRAPEITFWTARANGDLAGVGALKELDRTHGEVKSMHTAAAWRQRGIARALAGAILAEAERRGYERVSLETGGTSEFAPARALYTALGFRPCERFADYPDIPHSVFMTRVVADRERTRSSQHTR